MDYDNPHPLAPVDEAPSHGLGPVEPGDGVGALLCVDRRQCVLGHVAAPESRRRASTGAGVLLRGDGPARDRAPRAGRRDVLCPAVGFPIVIAKFWGLRNDPVILSTESFPA